MNHNIWIGTAFVVFAVLIASPLRVGGARTYGITSLGRNNCTGIDNFDSDIGDDRGGMALTPTTVFLNGDEHLGALPAATLDTHSTFDINDGLFSDLGDGSLWVLAYNDTAPLNNDDSLKNITHLIPVNESMGRDFSRSIITLSRPLDPNWYGDQQPVMFAGVRCFVFASSVVGSDQNSGLFHVSVSTGLVRRIYPVEGAALPSNGWAWHVTQGSIEESENWAAFGVMEENAGYITLVAAGTNETNSPGVHRWGIDGSVVTTIFGGSISDAASLIVNYFAAGTANDRWWVHAEGSANVFSGADGFATTNEWLVSCPAEHHSYCGNGQLDAGEACDDGNLTNGDGCNDACERSSSSSMASPLGSLLALLSAF
jgi:cysteine-rich repeat protein